MAVNNQLGTIPVGLVGLFTSGEHTQECATSCLLSQASILLHDNVSRKLRPWTSREVLDALLAEPCVVDSILSSFFLIFPPRVRVFDRLIHHADLCTP